MAQTFFIDSDEEIISVIGQLRKSSDPENYFVFPKRSLVLQSAVNLRLFQREAEKQGKKIIIVSQVGPKISNVKTITLHADGQRLGLRRPVRRRHK